MDRSPILPPHEADDTVYPTSDGEPMAETPWHRDQMFHLIESFRQLCAGRDEVQVGGNEMFYWERGNPRATLSPDVWVALDYDEPVDPFGSFQLWVQGKGPDLVVEACSRKTRKNDFGAKKEIYRTELRVTEYVIWDVDLRKRGGLNIRGLYAWRLDRLGRYRPVALDDEGAFVSQVLDGARLRFDPASRFLRVIAPDGRMMAGSAAEGRLEGHREGRLEGHREGRLEGQREGRLEGRLEGARAMLTTALEARFGALPDWLRERIEALATEASVGELLARGLSVEDVESLRARR